MTTELSRSVLSIYRDWICISLDEDTRPISYQQTLDAFNYALDVLTEKQKLEDKLKFESKSSESTSKSNTGLEATIEVATSISAADVVSVRHGRWVKMKGMMPPEYHGHYECSECGWHPHRMRSTEDREEEFTYCPNCGAKMDGGQDLIEEESDA